MGWGRLPGGLGARLRRGVAWMRHPIRWFWVGMAGAGFALAAAVSPVQGAIATGWRQEYLAHIGRGNLLLGIAAPGRNDAWAVGEYVQQPGPIILRWNGAYWRSVRVPGAGRAFEPASVYATSPNDVWILGSIWRNGLDEALHWNGTVWRSIVMPTGSIGTNETAILSPTSVWAIVAGICRPGCSSPASYWNGISWSNAEIHHDTWAIVAAGQHAYVLAVTHYRTQNQSFVPVLYERSHRSWRLRAEVRQRLVNPVIAGNSGGDVWIWGQSPGSRHRGVLYQWDGHRLRRVAVPAGLSTTEGLAADGLGGVWAGPSAHWTGTKWIDLGSAVAPFNGLATALAPVPGTGTTWLAGWLDWQSRAEGFIAVNGATP